MSALSQADPAVPTAAGGSRGVLARMDWLSRLAAAVLTVLAVAAVAGRVTRFAGDPTETGGPRLAPPSADYPLGTDSLGRSLLPRLLDGIGTTLLLTCLAVALTAVVSTALGIVAGYYSGRVGGLVLRVVDVLYAFPAIVLAILVAAMIGPGWAAAGVSIVLVTVPLMTRMVYAASISVARRDFVSAALVSGVSAPQIMRRHVLRNVSGTIAIQGTYALSVGILVEGGLSFLGYGVQLPQSSLGLLIFDGNLYMVSAPWLIIAPGVVLILAILSINLVGDTLRDQLEPREARSL